MFISVDLPEPEGPMMATISPRSIVRSMSLSTAMDCSPLWNLRPRPLRAMMGARLAPGAGPGVGLMPMGVASFMASCSRS